MVRGGDRKVDNIALGEKVLPSSVSKCTILPLPEVPTLPSEHRPITSQVCKAAIRDALGKFGTGTVVKSSSSRLLVGVEHRIKVPHDAPWEAVAGIMDVVQFLPKVLSVLLLGAAIDNGEEPRFGRSRIDFQGDTILGGGDNIHRHPILLPKAPNASRESNSIHSSHSIKPQTPDDILRTLAANARF